MLSFLKKDPAAKLKKQYSAMLKQAMEAQRKGDIRTYSELTDKAQTVFDQLAELEKNR